MILEAWWEVRRMVKKGTEESEEALQSFLDRYAEHSLAEVFRCGTVFKAETTRCSLSALGYFTYALKKSCKLLMIDG